MTAEDANDFDYAAAVVETLREAGGPISYEELWDRIMRRPDVPADDRGEYWTPPFTPGLHPRNLVMLKITVQVSRHTDASGLFPDAPLITTEEGYWLPEWGPIPLVEQQRRAQLSEERTHRANEPKPKVWPELDPYPETSRASEDELRDVAEKLGAFGSLVSGQRIDPVPLPTTFSRVIQKRMEEDGTLDANRRYHAERDRRIGVLMEWYGNAVRRTKGADPQDLFTLVNLGLIRDPERTAPPTQQRPGRDAPGPSAKPSGGDALPLGDRSVRLGVQACEVGDRTTARTWFQRAADFGDDEATREPRERPTVEVDFGRSPAAPVVPAQASGSVETATSPGVASNTAGSVPSSVTAPTGRARDIAAEAADISDPFLRSVSLSESAEALAAEGYRPDAREVANRARGTADTISDHANRTEALARAAEALAAAGDEPAARKAANRAHYTSTTINDPAQRRDARLRVASVLGGIAAGRSRARQPQS